MRIAILGATSQIARDLIVSFSSSKERRLHLFARRPDAVTEWLASVGLSERYPVDSFSGFAEQGFDAVINFVGVSNPEKMLATGKSVFDVTLRFDEMVMAYLKAHPSCRYLFLSSGAAYGGSFKEPVKNDTPALVAINNIAPQEWYGVAKLHAECRHRAHPEFSIFDIRVFNYFSCTQDLSARFLITDIMRAIRDRTVLKTSSDSITRDYLHPSDFHQLVNALLSAPDANAAVDCYTQAPIDKSGLLAAMREKFGLRYEVGREAAGVNATGSKPCYYSQNTRAADFGYQPRLTSLEGVLQEASAILGVEKESSVMKKDWPT